MSIESEDSSTGVAGAVRDWWWSLQDERPGGERNPMSDRGALARLRRAATVAEAMAEEVTHDLWRRLPGDLRKEKNLPRVALIAHVLAHVRANVDRHPMAALGRQSPDDEDSAKLKPIRFRRLLAAREDKDLMDQMRRLVALADGEINVGVLGASLLYWNDATRTRWAFEYFAAGAAAPRRAGTSSTANSTTAVNGTAP